MVILLKILQVVLALSLLVLVHEFGHFIFARLFKIRVEKFYLFLTHILVSLNTSQRIQIRNMVLDGFHLEDIAKLAA